jgi:hypothetical protein
MEEEKMSILESIVELKGKQAKIAVIEADLAGQVHDLCKQLFEESGKGPYDMGDGREGGYIIATRKGSGVYFLTPANKLAGKPKKTPEEKAAAKAAKMAKKSPAPKAEPEPVEDEDEPESASEDEDELV